jgi:hypothetical protein
MNSSILFSIEASLSSFLFTKVLPLLGLTLVEDGNVSQVSGSYILHNNLSIAFSFDNSNKTTL